MAIIASGVDFNYSCAVCTIIHNIASNKAGFCTGSNVLRLCECRTRVIGVSDSDIGRIGQACILNSVGGVCSSKRQAQEQRAYSTLNPPEATPSKAFRPVVVISSSIALETIEPAPPPVRVAWTTAEPLNALSKSSYLTGIEIVCCA